MDEHGGYIPEGAEEFTALDSREAHSSGIEGLPAQLGLEQEAALQQISSALIEAINTNNQRQIEKLTDRYFDLGESAVDRVEGQDRMKVQIALIISRGLIWNAAGQTDRYYDELLDALDYASNTQDEDLIETLNNELDRLESQE